MTCWAQDPSALDATAAATSATVADPTAVMGKT